MVRLAEPSHKDLTDRDRGQKAEALLNSDLLKEAFDTLETAYIEAWKTNGASMTAPDQKMPTRLDEKGRDRIWMSYQVLQQVKGHLERLVKDGRDASTLIAADLQKGDR